MIFLIDFENVSNSGFDGIENLSEKDTVIIFYSENAGKISMAAHRKLETSSSEKIYFSVSAGGKNALDFQLSTYLGYLVATHKNEKYCIVSNDDGYRFVADFWKEKNITISRSSNLFNENKEDLMGKIEVLLPDYKSDLKVICTIINKYKTKIGINNALVKEFGTEKTGVIYKALKGVIKNKK